jgi:hypothetical protein
MATTKKSAPAQTAPKLGGFVKDQIDDAHKRLVALEAEAQKVLENLVDRGQKSRKEVETLLGRLQGLEQVKDVKKLGKKASAASTEVQKRLNVLQARVIETVGVASGAQVNQINRELVKLSRKLDTLVAKKATKADARD